MLERSDGVKPTLLRFIYYGFPHLLCPAYLGGPDGSGDAFLNFGKPIRGHFLARPPRYGTLDQHNRYPATALLACAGVARRFSHNCMA